MILKVFPGTETSMLTISFCMCASMLSSHIFFALSLQPMVQMNARFGSILICILAPGEETS